MVLSLIAESISGRDAQVAAQRAPAALDAFEQRYPTNTIRGTVAFRMTVPLIASIGGYKTSPRVLSL